MSFRKVKMFRTNFISGLFILVPFAAILWLILFVLGTLGGIRHYLPAGIGDSENFFIKLLVSLLFLFLILIFIASVGWISRRFIGRQILAFLEETVSRVPMLRSIYSAIKQLVDIFSNKDGKFKAVCLVEFPRAGVKSIGFITGETILNSQKYFCVFVPTTPNPTSGFTLLLKEGDFESLDISVEDAFKTIISMGALAP